MKPTLAPWLISMSPALSQPQVFELMGADELHDFVTLIVTFIGAPKYVKNPYLRATFTKLLRFLIPRSDDEDRRHVSDRLSVVLHTHPLAKRFLAPAVMQARCSRSVRRSFSALG